MRYRIKSICFFLEFSTRIGLFLVLLSLSTAGMLQAQTESGQAPAPPKERSSSIPDLAEIIPLASDLAGKFARLENKVQVLPDVSAVQKGYVAHKEAAENAAARLQKIKNSGGRKRARLISLSQELQDVLALSMESERPLTSRIKLLDDWKAKWLAEKKRWQDWESRLLGDNQPPQLKTTFDRAEATIDTALKLIMQQLDAMLQLQNQSSAVRTRIEVLNAEINSLISGEQRDYLFTAAPPMFSPEYFSQFRGELWQTSLENIQILSWPNLRYFTQHGWTLIVQLFLFLAVILSVHKNRQGLRKSEHWDFLAARPFSSGFFIVVLTQLLFPRYQLLPISLQMVFVIVGGISFARILGSLIEQSWKRRAAKGVIIFLIVSSLLTWLSIPQPLYRLYTLLAALLSLFYLIRWVRAGRQTGMSIIHVWGLRVAYLPLGIIVLFQLFGKEGLGTYLFDSLVKSLSTVLTFILLFYMIRGGLRWLFHRSPVWNIKELRSEAEHLPRRIGYLVESLIVVFVLLPTILFIWGGDRSVPEATAGLLALGFDVGTQRISVGLVLVSAGTLYGSLLLALIVPRVLMDEAVAGGSLQRGVRISVERLIHYFIVFIGLLVAISILGLDLTKLTIILSALGVGIGFGLQGIVNNFISGLILLFERPVRIGDTIEMTGIWAEITRIGLRSTTVRTYDESEVIIPNADLVSNQVTNWTLSNRLARITIPVGVAYGSDVPLVFETLMACAGDHEMIVKSPPPQVLFRSFGDSSLNFELRAWVPDADLRLPAISDLHQEIDRRFREAKIEISFPQRDLHLRSVDNSVIVQHRSGDAGAE